MFDASKTQFSNVVIATIEIANQRGMISSITVLGIS